MTNTIYFWKPTEKNGFLGNWYYSPFIKDGIRFINNEQYFMWKKQQLFNPTNDSLEKNILEATNPAVIRKLGRYVQNFDQTVWDEKKYDIMKVGLIEKFLQNTHLKKALLETNDSVIVEASPYDTIWGIGLNEGDARIKQWRGENLLGKALMDVRTILISSNLSHFKFEKEV
jgi:ribA/ribD-fused uncharacterized protein